MFDFFFHVGSFFLRISFIRERNILWYIVREKHESSGSNDIFKLCTIQNKLSLIGHVCVWELLDVRYYLWKEISPLLRGKNSKMSSRSFPLSPLSARKIQQYTQFAYTRGCFPSLRYPIFAISSLSLNKIFPPNKARFFPQFMQIDERCAF